MKKITSSLALAAVVAAPTAQAVEWQVNDDTMFSVYGTFELMYLVNEERATDDGVEGQSEVVDNGSTIGFEGEHAFGNGLSGYFRAEFEHEADEKVANDGISDTDEVFVGLEGGFGALQLGTWDGIYQDSLSDVFDVFEGPNSTEVGKFSTEAGDQLAYFSPDFGGFSFEAQVAHAGEGETVSGDQELGLILVGKYATDLFNVHVGYDNAGLDASGGEEGDHDGQYGAAVMFDLSPFNAGVKYEYVGESGDDTDDALSAYGVVASYDYGVGSLTGVVQRIAFDDEDESAGRTDRTEFLVNANYSIADNLYVYIENGMYDRQDDLGDYTGVGTVYSF